MERPTHARLSASTNSPLGGSGQKGSSRSVTVFMRGPSGSARSQKWSSLPSTPMNATSSPGPRRDVTDMPSSAASNSVARTAAHQDSRKPDAVAFHETSSTNRCLSGLGSRNDGAWVGPSASDVRRWAMSSSSFLLSSSRELGLAVDDWDASSGTAAADEEKGACRGSGK